MATYLKSLQNFLSSLLLIKNYCLQFDSGGPILWKNPTSKRLIHVGIISFGKSCAGFLPGVNIRVGSFIDWIIEVTPGSIKIVFVFKFEYLDKKVSMSG